MTTEQNNNNPTNRNTDCKKASCVIIKAMLYAVVSGFIGYLASDRLTGHKAIDTPVFVILGLFYLSLNKDDQDEQQEHRLPTTMTVTQRR